MRKIGLSDKQIALYPYSSPFREKVLGLTKRQVKLLEEKGFLDKDADDAPSWYVQISYRWKQKFPAGQIVHVHHEYQPFVSGGPGYMYPSDFGKENIFCMDSSFNKSLNKVFALHVDNDTPFSRAHVDYILKTANTWKDGIEDFTLILTKENPKELVSLCFPGEMKHVNDLTLQSHITHSKPTSDLNVLFTNVDNTHDGPDTGPYAPPIK